MTVHQNKCGGSDYELPELTRERSISLSPIELDMIVLKTI